MSADRMSLAQAKRAAAYIVEALSPFCDRIEVAGSVRRERETCKDVEIVCIPKVEIVPSLFGVDGRWRVRGFEAALDGWRRVKGSATEGRYCQRIVPFEDREVALDLFVAVPENYGLILAIRTGSAEYSHEVLAKGWVQAGYRSKDGMLRDVNCARVEVREEAHRTPRHAIQQFLYARFQRTA